MRAFFDVLMDDHRGFQVMLGVLEACARRLQDGGEVPTSMLADVVDFFELFADRHHRTEETVLFPIVARHGLGTDKSVVNALLTQHDAGRAYTRKMRADIVSIEHGFKTGATEFAHHARAYAELIAEHIRIEDAYFYGLADQLLTSAERAAVPAAFAAAHGSRSMTDRERYERMIREYPPIVAAWSAGVARVF
jgi:hemerythrin-like domain-containing protein